MQNAVHFGEQTGFLVETVAVQGPGRVTLDAVLLVSAAHSCRSFLTSVFSCRKRGRSQAGSAQASARAHLVHLLGDRPTVVKIFTRSCLLILYRGDCFSANAFRVPVSEQLLSTDTALLDLVLGLEGRFIAMFICLLRKTFSNA